MACKITLGLILVGLVCSLEALSPIQIKKTSQQDPRIVDGIPTTPTQFPYIVSLNLANKDYLFGHFCGGSLIKSPTEDNPVVLTAAHCLEDLENTTTFYTNYIEQNLNEKVKDPITLYVDIGRTRVKSTEYEGQEQVYDHVKASRWTIHPDYNTSTSANDIAVIELSREIDTSEVTDVSEVTWSGNYGSPQSLDPNDYLTVIGYGANMSGGNLSPTLEYVNVTYMNNSVCNQYFDLYVASENFGFTVDWANPNFTKARNVDAGFITGDMMCAHAVHKDSCQGDSGGPLVIPGVIGDGTDDIQVGVVSWGFGCAGGTPGVYASVYYFQDWIQACLDYYDGDSSFKKTCGVTTKSKSSEKGVTTLMIVVGALALLVLVVICFVCILCIRKKIQSDKDQHTTSNYVNMEEI